MYDYIRMSFNLLITIDTIMDLIVPTVLLLVYAVHCCIC